MQPHRRSVYSLYHSHPKWKLRHNGETVRWTLGIAGSDCDLFNMWHSQPCDCDLFNMWRSQHSDCDLFNMFHSQFSDCDLFNLWHSQHGDCDLFNMLHSQQWLWLQHTAQSLAGLDAAKNQKQLHTTSTCESSHPNYLIIRWYLLLRLFVGCSRIMRKNTWTVFESFTLHLPTMSKRRVWNQGAEVIFILCCCVFGAHGNAAQMLKDWGGREWGGVGWVPRMPRSRVKLRRDGRGKTVLCDYETIEMIFMGLFCWHSNEAFGVCCFGFWHDQLDGRWWLDKERGGFVVQFSWDVLMRKLLVSCEGVLLGIVGKLPLPPFPTLKSAFLPFRVPQQWADNGKKSRWILNPLC